MASWWTEHNNADNAVKLMSQRERGRQTPYNLEEKDSLEFSWISLNETPDLCKNMCYYHLHNQILRFLQHHIQSKHTSSKLASKMQVCITG